MVDFEFEIENENVRGEIMRKLIKATIVIGIVDIIGFGILYLIW